MDWIDYSNIYLISVVLFGLWYTARVAYRGPDPGANPFVVALACVVVAFAWPLIVLGATCIFLGAKYHNRTQPPKENP